MDVSNTHRTDVDKKGQDEEDEEEVLQSFFDLHCSSDGAPQGEGSTQPPV